MKILLTGASGQLGKEILNTKPFDCEIIIKNRSELDLSSQKSCLENIQNNKPNWIINCAAYTNVEKAEDEKELAYKINSLAPKYFSEIIKDYGGDLLHISSDYVFDGKKGSPYLPNDKKAPLGIYGSTKSIGEDFIIENLSDINKGHIIRTSWLLSPYGNNFALKILKKLDHENQLKIIYDQIGSPTSACTLAKVCWQTIILKSKGINIPKIMHYSDAGIASWYDIAITIEEIGRELGLIKKEVKIIPILSSSYPSKVKRPKYSVLNTKETIDKLFIDSIPWRKSLKDLLNKLI